MAEGYTGTTEWRCPPVRRPKRTSRCKRMVGRRVGCINADFRPGAPPARTALGTGAHSPVGLAEYTLPLYSAICDRTRTVDGGTGRARAVALGGRAPIPRSPSARPTAPFGAGARAASRASNRRRLGMRVTSLHGPHRPPGPVDDERSELGRHSRDRPTSGCPEGGNRCVLAASLTKLLLGSLSRRPGIQNPRAARTDRNALVSKTTEGLQPGSHEPRRRCWGANGRSRHTDPSSWRYRCGPAGGRWCRRR